MRALDDALEASAAALVEACRRSAQLEGESEMDRFEGKHDAPFGLPVPAAPQPRKKPLARNTQTSLSTLCRSANTSLPRTDGVSLDAVELIATTAATISHDLAETNPESLPFLAADTLQTDLSMVAAQAPTTVGADAHCGRHNFHMDSTARIATPQHGVRQQSHCTTHSPDVGAAEATRGHA